MQKNNGFSAFNLGNGDGFSVLEMIKSCEDATNLSIPYQTDDRRAGDPEALIANSTKAKELLGWNLQYGDLNTIVSTALKWHKTYKNNI